MYTRNLRILNPDITEKQLSNTKCTFRKQFSIQVILGVVKKDHYEIIKRKSWLKSSGWFEWKIWEPVFKMLEEAPVERIYFCTFVFNAANFRNSDLLYNIVHISFPKLRQLHLQDNLISNIQPIIAFMMPNLRKLDLRRNLIMQISCIKRCHFSRLQEINLSDNIIRNCNDIAECYFPDLKRIIIEEKTYPNIYMIHQQGRGQRELKSNSRVNGYDLRWILRLQTKHVDYIKYAADARIIRKQLEEQIGAKYYKIRVEKKNMQKGSLLPLMSF